MRQNISGLSKGGHFDVRRPTPVVAIALDLLEQDKRIQAKYDALGGAAAMGQPISKDTGKVWTFKGACLCYDPASAAAYHVHGAIYQKWQALGGRSFGAPSTDELPTPDGVGRYSHFSGNTASIYWTPNTGAQAVYGDIRKKWAALGWENSYLGYPVTDETTFPGGGKANGFQHGDIYWWPDTGAIDLGDVVARYTGFYCFKETRADTFEGTDSPYAVIAVTSRPNEHHSVPTRTYEDVNDNHAQPDDLELYRGRPYGLALGVVLMEHDQGDVNEDRQKMREAFLEAHKKGVELIEEFIPGKFGPIVANIVDALLGKIIPELGVTIYDALGLSDDRIGGCTMAVTAKDMILMAARGSDTDFHGISHRFESPMISGLSAQYKMYFTVEPA